MLRATGDLTVARQNDEKALATMEELKQKSDASYVRISLAALALDENRTAEAKNLAETAIMEFASEKDADGEAGCRAILALANMLQGNREEAIKQSQEAQRLAARVGDKIVELEARITEIRARVPQSSPAQSEAKLRAVEREAKKAGFAQVAFEARLALGEVQTRSGRTVAGQQTLHTLAQDAKARGFELIARKAENEKQSTPSQ